MTGTPDRLIAVLRCLECGGSLRCEDAETLKCENCDSRYPVKNGIPSIIAGGPEKQDWNPWDLDRVKMMGNSYYKRATGELPEKEASKSYARYLQRMEFYEPGDTVLDLGCATGHFLRSFRRLLDPQIQYTGIDSDPTFLQWGREAYGIDSLCNFVHGDVLQLPLADDAFDVVVVNLFHFFPRLDDALGEAMRAARKRVVWRTPVGQVNYIVKVIYNQSFDELRALTPDREDFDYSLYMLYSVEYIKGLVAHLGGKVVDVERDTDFEDFDNTALEEFKHIPSTKTVNGMQINGNLVLDWHYITIESGDARTR